VIEKDALRGKVALVTGAGRGIGRAIALGLARAGGDVAIADIHLEPFRGESYYRLRERWSGDDEDVPAAEAVRKLGRASVELAVDVADRDEVRSAVAECESQLGAVDILVNNAGIVNNIASIEQMELDAWEHELRVNLTGAFNCVQATVPAMATRGWGRVVNIASVAALQPALGQPAYSSSKAGLIALTQAVAQEFGTRGVTANAVLPGLIGTPLVRSMPGSLRDSIVARSAVGRLGEPADVASLVTFLATPAAGFVSAVAIPCDGGFLGAPCFGLDRG
jgi:3-oxoacyl-[acyl-carrier protein] reductase